MKINLGCGAILKDGFLNIDFCKPSRLKKTDLFTQYDLSKGLPPEIKNLKTVQAIVSSHFLEHLTVSQIKILLKDCFSALSPEGVFYAEIPDFPSCVKAYLNKDQLYFNDPNIKAFSPSGLFAEFLNYSLHQVVNNKPEHVSFLDVEFMIYMLKEAGFKTAFEASFDEKLGNADPLRQRYSLYIKAYPR